MKIRLAQIFILLSAIYLNTSCANKAKTVAHPVWNDTTEVIRLLLDTGLIGHHIIDQQYLLRDNPFGDSIIFQYDDLVVNHMPVFDTMKFKFLTKDQMCDLVTRLKWEGKWFPHYLRLVRFEKSDTFYRVALENAGVFPWFDKKGNPLKNPLTGKLYEDTAKCGFSGNGGFEMVINVKNNTLKAKVSSHWAY